MSMSGWRGLIIGAVLLGCVLASQAVAAGAVRLDWDTCAMSPVNRTLMDPDPVQCFVTVRGQAEAHDGYHVRLAVIPSTGSAFPDAWRFDVAGCQGSNYIEMYSDDPTGFLSKTCPVFSGTATALTIRDYSVDPTIGRGQIVFAKAYPSGSTSFNPAWRYFLFVVIFEHYNSTVGATVPGTSCGGLETPICLLITLAEWHSMDGVTAPWAIERESITVNDPAATACSAATPARPSTWGAVKDQYRR